MIYHMKLSLFVFLTLIFTSIPISFIYYSDVLQWPGGHIIFGILCSWMLLWAIEKKVPTEIVSIVMPIAYLSLVLTGFLSLRGFGPLFDGL
jgi:hypothetical protein